MTTNRTIVTGKTGRQWEIEFPTMCNGHQTTSTGFITPLNFDHNTDFFTLYDDGRISTPGYFPDYVLKAARRFARHVKTQARQS